MLHKALKAAPLLAFPLFSLAQKTTPVYEVGGQLGTLVSQTDLSYHPIGSYDYLRPSWSIYAGRELDGQLSARLQLSRGVTAQNEADYTYVNPAWKPHRGLAFRTRITELAGLVEYRPLGLNSYGQARRLSPYVLGGLGLAFTHVQRDASHFDTAYFGSYKSISEGLAADLSTAPPRLLLTVPVGLGMSFRLTDRWMLRGEALYRFTTSDYLDGFSKAGVSRSKDFFYTVQVGIGYRFWRNRYNCPSVR